MSLYRARQVGGLSRGGGETVAVQNRPEIGLNKHDTTSSLASGSTEVIEMYASPGEILRVFQNHFVVNNDADATSGSVDFKARFQNISPFEAVVVNAPYNVKITWDAAHLRDRSSMNTAMPQSDAEMADAFRDLRATANQPIKFEISNNLDVAHDTTRRIYTLFEREGY